MFLTEKSDGTVKGRMMYNVKLTRVWLSREDSTSPTTALESMFLTNIIGAKEKRDAFFVPNTFIHTPISDENKKVTMKIIGVLVHLMVENAPEVYVPYVIYENGKEMMYVTVFSSAWDACCIPTLGTPSSRRTWKGVDLYSIHMFLYYHHDAKW